MDGGVDYFISCFNRTFMELKYHLVVSRLELVARFNRTFMELKSHKYLTEQVFYIVLSEPLHN